ncbi:MAG TPA: hypothetical protein VLY21_04165 [Nitrososphaerales archaeon]|nr:hypothetical protein [Nitrososphaerales archaeon]
MSDFASLSDAEKLNQLAASLERTSKRLQWVSIANIILLVALVLLIL